MSTFPDRTHVDLVLHTVLDRGARTRSERLVLRRTAATALPDGTEVTVTQRWATAAQRSARQSLEIVRRLDGAAERLLLGHPIDVFPDWHPLDPDTVEELAELTGRPGADTERLVGFRGTLRDLPEQRRLVAADVVSNPGGVLVRPARQVVLSVLRGLLPPAGDPDPDLPDDLDRDLRGDLHEARLGFEQRDRWAWITDGQLIDIDRSDQQLPGAAGTEGPVFARWQRQTADGEAVTADTVADPGTEALVVTLVGVDGTRLDWHLLRGRTGPELDLHTLWQHRSVQAALAEFAASRGDPAKREAVVAALREAGEPGRADWTAHPEPDGRRLADAVHRLAGTVMISDCHRMRIGDCSRQFTTFGYTVTPDAPTGELLRAHPEVVESIVDYACRLDGSDRPAVERALSTAVCGRASGPLLAEPGSGALPWPTFRRTAELAQALERRGGHPPGVTAVISRAVGGALEGPRTRTRTGSGG